MKSDALVGCMLGTAVGDALGLPYEGLTASHARKLFGPPDRYHFALGYGMVSDDTDHACATAAALAKSGGNWPDFEHVLARSLRWWLLTLPPGIGWATLRSIIKLWLRRKPDRSGVFSAGNGPAMRSPILGVALGDAPVKLKDFVLHSTRLTHTDPRAYHGALTVALAASVSAHGADVTSEEFMALLQEWLTGEEADELLIYVDSACESAARDDTVQTFAQIIGCERGISGYMLHTVACVIQTWLRYQNDYIGALYEIIQAGGDTDTTAGIVGGIIGARVGKQGIPENLLKKLLLWPQSIEWMEQLAHCIAEYHTPPPIITPGLLPRNLASFIIILAHIVLRAGAVLIPEGLETRAR